MQAPHRVEKPWGYEIWWAHTDSYAGKLLQVEQGHRLSLQYHQRKDESCYVLSGLVPLVKGPSVDELEEVDLGPGSCWRNRPGEIHTLEAVKNHPGRGGVHAAAGRCRATARRLRPRPGRHPSRSADDTARAGAADRYRPGGRQVVDAPVRGGRRSRRPRLPQPTAYFRGRILWEEASMAAWQGRPVEVPEEMRTAHAG